MFLVKRSSLRLIDMEEITIKTNISAFLGLVEGLYKLFNVIEYNDTISIEGYPYKFRVIDIYDNGEIDVIIVDPPPDPQIFEGRQRTSLRGAILYRKFFRSYLRESKNDNGWRQVGGVFFNIYSMDKMKNNEPSMFRLPPPPSPKTPIALPPIVIKLEEKKEIQNNANTAL